MKKSTLSVFEYSLSFLLLALNLINYEMRVNSLLFFALSTVLFVPLFFICHRKSKNFLAASVMMLCHTWQISWINIFGAPTADLQLPWFYVIGAILVLYTLTQFKWLYYSKQVNAFFLALIVFVIIILPFPLFSSPSISEGLKEFIMIMFFVILIVIAFLFTDTVSKDVREDILNAYGWCVFITCFFLIFQAVAHQLFGISLFYQSEGTYFGNATLTSGLLMKDLSSASIMLGSAVFIYVSRIEKKQYVILNIIQLVVTVIGLALTNRRTGTVSLIIILAFYALTHYKSAFKKIAAICLFSVIIAIMLYYLAFSRAIESIDTLFYENKRIENYIAVIKMTFAYPFGVGYGDSYTRTFMEDGVIPHNTFLRWMLMGGPILAIPLISIPIYTLIQTFKKKMTTEFWIILYAVFASNFIPDLLNARFFVIPCMCALLICKTSDTSKKPQSLPLKKLK